MIMTKLCVKFWNDVGKVNLKLNLKKCRFEQAELKYLGHIIGSGTIKPDPDKVRAIKEIPTPTSAEDLRRFWEW